VVLGHPASAVDVLVERLRPAAFEVGDDEACVSALRADFDAGDDALGSAPTGGSVEELLEAPDFARACLGLLDRRREARRRAGLDGRHMPAQGGSWRNAENKVDAIGAAPVDDQRAAVVAVAPDQDPRLRPVGPDRADEATQMRADFRAARALRRTQDRGDEPALAIEYHDRLEAVFVVMGVEQPQLLATMHRVEGVVDIEHDPLWRLAERGAIEIDHRFPHHQQ